MRKSLNIALAGNPNSGKTTIFNAITGAGQHVGNWPGVTVEKKEGIITYKDRKIHVVDLPGKYSLTALSAGESNGSASSATSKENGVQSFAAAYTSFLEKSLP